MVELVVVELLVGHPMGLIVLRLMMIVVAAAVADCQMRYQAMKLFELVPVVGQLEE